MGAPMVRRLAVAGYRLRVWNRSSAKADACRGPAIDVCRSPAEALQGVETVFLCLTDAKAVSDVLFTDPETLLRLGEVATVVDFSTIGMDATLQFAGRLANASGGSWIDAPVSGGVAGATSGTLAMFVGGNGPSIERVFPALRHLARCITHMGGVGTGQATKLCNQLIVAGAFVAIAEAVSLAQYWNIAAEKLPDALAGGWADSGALQIFGARMAAVTDPGPTVSRLTTMYKDLVAIRTEAGAQALPVLAQIMELFADQIDAGYGEQDFPALMNTYRMAAMGGRT